MRTIPAKSTLLAANRVAPDAGRLVPCHHLLVAATVLIVDDHAGFRSFARALLEAEGFEVVAEAADGAAALALGRTLAPELVLLDVALPDMDGLRRDDPPPSRSARSMTKSCTRRDPDGTPGTFDGPSKKKGRLAPALT